jgi:hypothetical protein
MAIKVQCPNSSCGKVLLVKDGWAGKKGGCTECGSVIQVPLKKTVADTPSLNLDLPTSSEDTVAEKEVEYSEEVISDEEVVVEEETSEEDFLLKAKDKNKGVKARPASTSGDDEEPLGDDAFSAVDAEPRPNVRLPRLTLICLALGILSLACVALWPVLGRPSISGSGDFKNIPQFNVTSEIPLNEAGITVVCGIPAFGALIAAVGLIFPLRKGRFGLATLLTAYPAWISSLLMAILFTTWLITALDKLNYQKEQINALLKDPKKAGATRLVGLKGDFTISVGSGYYTGAIAGILAGLLLTMTIYLVHKSLWSRIVFLVLLVLIAGGGGTLAYMAVNSR